jgi:fructose-1,6-bisphosphatase/inositol monophosphatase family enzyme
VHGFPHSCISIGFALKSEVVVGVVFNPMLDTLYTAVKGCGSFKNGKRLHVSETTELKVFRFALRRCVCVASALRGR